MATLTAVAAGGNWNTASTWSPAQVPTAADDCKINATMTGTVTINGTAGSPSLCRSLDCTGCTHTLAANSVSVLNIGNSAGGNLKLVAGMTYNPDPASVINFVSTTTGITVTTAGKTMGTLTFNGVGGSWTLQDNLTLASASALTLTAGTLKDNGKTVTAATGFFSNNSNTRALTITGSWSVGFWDITTSSGITLTATGSTITLTGGGFFGGGLTYGSVVLPSNNPILYDSNTFAHLTYTGAASVSDTITFMANQTVTGTLTLSGNSVTNRLFLKSDIKGTQRTLTTATNSLANVDLQDIAGAGASGWNLSAITGNSGNCGGCSGITFTTPINSYMKTASPVAWSASNWYTTSGGSTHARVPLPQDTAIFDANSITAGSVQVNIDMPRISGMDWTGVINSPNLNANASISIFGDLTFPTGVTTSAASGAVTTFENRGSLNLNFGGNTFALGDLTQNGPGGTINLTGNLVAQSPHIHITSGTWNNGSYNFTADHALYVDGGTLNLGSGLLTCSDSLNLSAGLLEMNGSSVAAGATNISGGTLNLSGQITNTPSTGISGAITVSGGTIDDTGPAGELIGVGATFTGGTSVVRKLTISGNITLSSTSSLTITGSATSGGLTIADATCTFMTAGTPTWSAGSLTIMNGGSWTFC